MVMASSSNGDLEREAELLAAFDRLQVDGVLVTPVRAVPEALERLAGDGLPVVLMDWDGAASTLKASSSTIITVPFRRPGCSSTEATAASRWSVVRRRPAQPRIGGADSATRWKGRGLAPSSELIRSGPFTHEQGRVAALDLLSLAQPPEAIERQTSGQHVVLESRLVVRESHWRQSRVKP
jgi:hypothetical protein